MLRFVSVEPTGGRQRETVEAVLRMVDDLTMDDIVPSLRQIADASGRAMPTMMKAFSSRHDLLLRVASVSSAVIETEQRAIENLAAAVRLLARVASSTVPGSMPNLVRQEARQHFVELIEDHRGFRRQLLFTWGAMGSTSADANKTPEASERESERLEFVKATTAAYQLVMDGYVSQYESLLEGGGRSVRSPFTIDDVAMILTALAEGLTMRLVADENVSPDQASDLFANGVQALLAAVTCGPEDERSVGDLFD